MSGLDSPYWDHFGAAYMLWAFQRVMFGEVDKPENDASATVMGAKWRIWFRSLF